MKRLVLLGAGLAVWQALAQSGSRPEFEAASIKPNTSANEHSSTRLTPGEVFIGNVSVRKSIALAYNVSEDRESAISAPTWVDFDRYDIQARFPANTSVEQVRIMFQNLLADRFGLKLHRETKEVPLYALVVANTGLKTRKSAPGAAGTFSMNSGHLAGRAIPLSALADRLSSRLFGLERPVIDRTGLQGLYDLDLEWMPENDAVDDSRPSLFTALQEQLGLRLEPQRGPVELLVVDSIERKPVEN